MSTADPAKLAAFYQQATGYEIVYDRTMPFTWPAPTEFGSGSTASTGSSRRPGHPTGCRRRASTSTADDLHEVEARMLALGATRPGHDLDTDGWIFLADPEGHIFCLTSVY